MLDVHMLLCPKCRRPVAPDKLVVSFYRDGSVGLGCPYCDFNPRMRISNVNVRVVPEQRLHL